MSGFADFWAGRDLWREPMIAGVLAGAVLGYIGVFVVLKRMVFVSAALSEISGVPEPRRKLPDLLLEELGLLTPVLPRGSFLRRLVLPRELVLHMKRLAPVENARTRAELGLKPTPLRSTLTAMIGTEGDLARRRASI